MVNISSSNFTNIGNMMTNVSKEGESQSSLYSSEVNCIIAIIINCVTCPFTVLLNVLVIMAVKRRPRLQSYTNILLACLAATDVLTGLVVQPSFILWKTLELLGMTYRLVRVCHNSLIRVLSVCSCLHLMLVTCERLIAIRFTMHYPYIVRKRNIKVAVIAAWFYAISCVALKPLTNTTIIPSFLLVFAINLCILFIAATYILLYRETRRHKIMIKTQQLPQEETERFTKESKALKTTVFVVGAVAFCFLRGFD